MNYRETVEYLFSMLPAYHRIGKPAYKADLDNTLELDRLFGHPHARYLTLHVAGTNGKGSVSHMLASVLQEAGYRTGLYTSPHLKDFRERIRINGKMIPEDEVVSFVVRHDSIIRRIKPSFFEMTVAMAFDYFARMEADVAVIETGMGGRLDSTNIITPVLSVITNIGHDHMEFLGDTLQAVAGEKAGIIKPGVPAVVGEYQPGISEVIIARAEALAAPVLLADRRYRCRLGRFSPATGIRHFTLDSLTDGTHLKGRTPLGGLAQQRNLQTVAAAVEVLSGRVGIENRHLIRGVERVVANTGLMGRWQILSLSPLTVCDTGHNREGLIYVLQQVRSLKRRRVHMVIGVVNDKETATILPLFPKDAVYYFTRASVPRALDERVLMAEAERYGLSGAAWPSVAEAVAAAQGAAAPDELIFIGGSTFVVADALQLYRLYG